MEKGGTDRFAIPEEKKQEKLEKKESEEKKPTRIPCPWCDSHETEVQNSYPATENPNVAGEWIKRRHHRCRSCRRSFPTEEKYRVDKQI